MHSNCPVKHGKLAELLIRKTFDIRIKPFFTYNPKNCCENTITMKRSNSYSTGISELQRLPFDWRNPFGYFVVIGFQYAMLSYLLLISACFVYLSIGSYIYITASIKCMKCSLFSIGRCASTADYDDDHINQTELLERFTELIQFQSFERELSTKYKFPNFLPQWQPSESVIFRSLQAFSDLFKGYFTALFLWSLSSMCGSLLMIQMQMVWINFN